MVDVTDGSHVHVRLGALVLLLRHCYSFFGSSLGSRLRDDFIGNRLRDFLVMMKFHAVDGPPLGLRPQVGGVAEHVAQRHVGAYHLHGGRPSIPRIWPRRDDRSPRISPMNSSGITTSTFMIGSSRAGWPLRMPSLAAIEPAMVNAISLESTSWYEPSTRVALTSTTG